MCEPDRILDSQEGVWVMQHLDTFAGNTLPREVSINPIALHAQFISASFVLQEVLEVHLLDVLDMCHEVQPLGSLRNDITCLVLIVGCLQGQYCLLVTSA